jgi:hypothetical protein
MTEQREEERHDLDCNLSVVDVESGVEFEAAGKNLSGHGLLFHAAMEPPVGADLHVSLSGARKTIRVLRVEAQAQGGFDVATRITR